MSLADDLLWLVDIPSPTGSEEVIRDAIAGRLGSDLPVRLVGRSVVVGEPTGKPIVTILGHLDTVPEQGNLPGRRDGDRVHGLGASDMKAGLAVMVDLLESEEARSGGFDVLGVFYDGEEGPAAGNGLEAVLDEVAAVQESQLAIVLEPTDGQVQKGCQGVVNALVEFHGRSAHSARPWLGENAISRAGAWLSDMHRRPAARVDVEGLTFNETFVVTTAAGGIAPNVVPDRLTLNLNHRFPPDRTVDEAIESVRAVCFPADAVTIVDIAPAAPIPPDSPLLSRLESLAGSVGAKTAWTDVARLAARGVPALNYGPGEVAMAHRADESASISAMERCADVLKALLEY